MNLLIPEALQPLNTAQINQIDSVLIQLSADRTHLQKHWCVPPEDGAILASLIRLAGSKRVLEIGTSIGYSSLWITHALCHTGGTLLTVDASQERQAQALQNAKLAGVENSIQWLCGDAATIMQSLVGNGAQFDAIFIDARKSDYATYAKLAEALLPSGGLLLADNVLSHAEKVRDFSAHIANSPCWESSLIPTTNGIQVCIFQA